MTQLKNAAIYLKQLQLQGCTRRMDDSSKPQIKNVRRKSTCKGLNKSEKINKHLTANTCSVLTKKNI